MTGGGFASRDITLTQCRVHRRFAHTAPTRDFPRTERYASYQVESRSYSANPPSYEYTVQFSYS